MIKVWIPIIRTLIPNQLPSSLVASPRPKMAANTVLHQNSDTVRKMSIFDQSKLVAETGGDAHGAWYAHIVEAVLAAILEVKPQERQKAGWGWGLGRVQIPVITQGWS